MLKSVVGLEFRVVNGKYSREWDWLCTVTTVQGYLNPPILSFSLSLFGVPKPRLSLSILQLVVFAHVSPSHPHHLHPPTSFDHRIHHLHLSINQPPTF